MLVASPLLQLAQVLLERVPDHGARGQPEGQPGPDQRVGAEQPELAAKLAVIFHGGLPGQLRRRAATRKHEAPGRSPQGL